MGGVQYVKHSDYSRTPWRFGRVLGVKDFRPDKHTKSMSFGNYAGCENCADAIGIKFVNYLAILGSINKRNNEVKIERNW
jgi:hypothetical protein